MSVAERNTRSVHDDRSTDVLRNGGARRVYTTVQEWRKSVYMVNIM